MLRIVGVVGSWIEELWVGFFVKLEGWEILAGKRF